MHFYPASAIPYLLEVVYPLCGLKSPFFKTYRPSRGQYPTEHKLRVNRCLLRYNHIHSSPCRTFLTRDFKTPTYPDCSPLYSLVPALTIPSWVRGNPLTPKSEGVSVNREEAKISCSSRPSELPGRTARRRSNGRSPCLRRTSGSRWPACASEPRPARTSRSPA